VPLTIAPFTEAHLQDAANLLAVEQKRRRALEPVLPAAFEDPNAAQGPLEEAFRTSSTAGYIALRDREPVAFLLAIARMPDRALTVPFHGHAKAPSEPFETYRELYAVLADDWVRRGFFTHRFMVLDGDRELRDCWDSLGFGRSLTTGVRDVTEPVADPPELDVRMLGAEHIDVITQLEVANARHHNASPVFVPYLPEDRERYRLETLDLLQEPRNAHFVAYEDGEPAGMNTFTTAARHSPLFQPESDVYLYQGIVYEPYRHAGIGRGLLARSMRWARDEGFTTCTLHWFSMNLSGARFWSSNGFRPAAHILGRRIDERIAWARP
jgi:GNAT superfamily N-acetyltransferase